MTITLTSDIEAAVKEQARQRGTSPETLALNTLREQFAAKPIHRPVPLIEPRDDWERQLARIGIEIGISLTDEQVSSEGIYQDYD